MSKRTFRSTPGQAQPTYPTLLGFLGRRGAALALGVLLGACDTEPPMMGKQVPPPALIDARTDSGAEAGPRSDSGGHSDTMPILPTRR
jgi:hypothetical protein